MYSQGISKLTVSLKCDGWEILYVPLWEKKKDI